MIGNQFDAFIHPFEVDMIKEELDRLKSELNCSGSLKSRSTVLRCRMKTRIQPKMEYPNYQFVQISGYMVSLENELSTSGVQTGPTFDSARSRAHPYLRSANGKLRSTNLFNCTNKSHNSVDSYGSDLSFDSTRSSTTNGSMSNSPLGLGNRSLASKPYGQNSRPKYLFVGLVQSIQRDPFEQLTLFESLQDEYNTLFALDCKLLAVDHRISNIIGFLPKEIINSYAYEHIHKNDQLISKIAHQMSKLKFVSIRLSQTLRLKVLLKLASRSNLSKIRLEFSLKFLKFRILEDSKEMNCYNVSFAMYHLQCFAVVAIA